MILLQIYVKFREVEPGMYRIKVDCRGIIFIRIQCSLVTKFFSRSWGRNFVGSVIEIILINIKQMFVYAFVWDVNSRARNTHESHEHWSPNE